MGCRRVKPCMARPPHLAATEVKRTHAGERPLWSNPRHGEAKMLRGDEVKITGDLRTANPGHDEFWVARGVFSSRVASRQPSRPSRGMRDTRRPSASARSPRTPPTAGSDAPRCLSTRASTRVWPDHEVKPVQPNPRRKQRCQCPLQERRPVIGTGDLASRSTRIVRSLLPVIAISGVIQPRSVRLRAVRPRLIIMSLDAYVRWQDRLGSADMQECMGRHVSTRTSEIKGSQAGASPCS
jgi:hypothetical protein